MTELTAEVVILGAGPGGYAAAFRAADLGKKVVLIDADPQGSALDCRSNGREKGTLGSSASSAWRATRSIGKRPN